MNKKQYKSTTQQKRHAWATHGLESGNYTLNKIVYLTGYKSLVTTQMIKYGSAGNSIHLHMPVYI